MHTQIHTDDAEGHAVFMYKRNTSVLPPPRYVFTQFLFVYSVFLCVLDLATCVHVSYEHMCINPVNPSGWFFFPLFLLEGAICTVIDKGKRASTWEKQMQMEKKMRTLRKPVHQFAPHAQHLGNALQIHTTQATDTWTCFPKHFHEEKRVYVETVQSPNQTNANDKCIIIIVSHLVATTEALQATKGAPTSWTRASFVVWLMVKFRKCISVHLMTFHLIFCHIKLLWNVLMLDDTSKRIPQSCCLFSATVSY